MAGEAERRHKAVVVARDARFRFGEQAWPILRWGCGLRADSASVQHTCEWGGVSQYPMCEDGPGECRLHPKLSTMAARGNA